MAETRPLVSVVDASGASIGQTPLPAVFSAPIRPDVVRFVHTNMAKNGRQVYAVNTIAGHQTSAESWGTGRAVSRIPRVAGGGWKVHPASKGGGRFASKIDRGRYFVPGEFHREGSAIWHVQEPRLTRPSTALPRKA